MKIEPSNPIIMLTNSDSHDAQPKILPFCPSKSEELNPIQLKGKELWRKASVKILTYVRMNNFNKFINNVYYGIGVEDKEFEDTLDEKVKWVFHF